MNVLYCVYTYYGYFLSSCEEMLLFVTPAKEGGSESTTKMDSCFRENNRGIGNKKRKRKRGLYEYWIPACAGITKKGKGE